MIATYTYTYFFKHTGAPFWLYCFLDRFW